MNYSTLYLLPAEWEHLKKILLAAQNSPPTKADSSRPVRAHQRTSRTPKKVKGG
jgi:hypothetical protein